jgi:hypothetical protein
MTFQTSWVVFRCELIRNIQVPLSVTQGIYSTPQPDPSQCDAPGLKSHLVFSPEDLLFGSDWRASWSSQENKVVSATGETGMKGIWQRDQQRELTRVSHMTPFDYVLINMGRLQDGLWDLLSLSPGSKCIRKEIYCLPLPLVIGGHCHLKKNPLAVMKMVKVSWKCFLKCTLLMLFPNNIPVFYRYRHTNVHYNKNFL